MNNHHYLRPLVSPLEKNFDINLKVNFESGHVSLGIPQNFKKKQAIQTFQANGNYPVRHIYSLPVSQSQQFNLNSQKQSVAQTINVVDCVICGKAYSENEFTQHLQFHKQRNAKIESQAQLSQDLRSPSQYTFQPQRERIGNSLSGSIPEICEMNQRARFAMLEYSKSQSQSSHGINFNHIRNGSTNIHFADHIFSQHNSNSRNSVSSQPLHMNNHPNAISFNGQGVYKQTPQPLIHPINQYRTYSVPDPREFQSYRRQEFNPFQMSRVSHGQSLSNYQGVQMQIMNNENFVKRSLPIQNFNERNQGIKRIAMMKNGLKGQINKNSNNQNENYENRMANNSAGQRNIFSLSEQTSPKRSTVESQLSESMKYSQVKQVRSRMIPQNTINLKKTDKLQNSLYNSFKNKEDSESEDEEGGFRLEKSKPILERMNSNDCKSFKLGQSGVSQMSQKSKSSKTKIPINYLAREEFIQSSVTNSSCN